MGVSIQDRSGRWLGIPMIKDLLCSELCAALEVRTVPAGYVLKTPYNNFDGDPLLIYCIKDGANRWRLEDDGAQVPLLEAVGVDLGGKSRGDAFQSLLRDHYAIFNSQDRTICTGALIEGQIGAAAVQFMGLLLRLQDLALMSPQIVRSTFREDALRAIHGAFDAVASVEEASSIDPEMAGQEADVVIRRAGSDPLGVYFATTEERALQAIVVKMETEKYRRVAGKVALLVETLKGAPVKGPTLGLALARLDAVLSFRDAQFDSMNKLSALAGTFGVAQ